MVDSVHLSFVRNLSAVMHMRGLYPQRPQQQAYHPHIDAETDAAQKSMNLHTMLVTQTRDSSTRWQLTKTMYVENDYLDTVHGRSSIHEVLDSAEILCKVHDYLFFVFLYSCGNCLLRD
jgi:hypothetical protein